MTRKSWDEYFLDIAYQIGERSTCDRLHVGCVIVDRENLIISTGYNGSIHGQRHCDDVGHLMNGTHCIRTIHAEVNALLHADISRVKDATIYLTHEPCEICTKFLNQSGISRVVFRLSYPSKYNHEFIGDMIWENLELKTSI